MSRYVTWSMKVYGDVTVRSEYNGQDGWQNPKRAHVARTGRHDRQHDVDMECIQHCSVTFTEAMHPKTYG